MNMFRSLFIYSFVLVFAVACQPGDGSQNAEEDPEMQKLKAEIEELKMKNQKKDSSFYSLVMTFNEIEENLSEIKEKEGVITVSTTEGTELNETNKEAIIADIQDINSLIQENKKKIASLRSKLSKSNMENSEAKKLIDRLAQQIENKELEIVNLKEQLATLQISMKLLNMENMEQQELIESQTNELNTAWFAYGTSKELQENGIVTKEGGFIGIGKTTKLKDDFERQYFTKIDITDTKQIELHSKEAKIITSHPTGSYEIDRGDKIVHKIVITNPEKFWSVSKYLVVIVEN